MASPSSNTERKRVERYKSRVLTNNVMCFMWGISGGLGFLRAAERSGPVTDSPAPRSINKNLYQSKFTIYMIGCMLHTVPFFGCKVQTVKLIPNFLHLKRCQCHLCLRGQTTKIRYIVQVELGNVNNGLLQGERLGLLGRVKHSHVE